MRRISSTGLSIFGAAVIVALSAFVTSAQAQYRGAFVYRGPHGGVAVARGYGYRGYYGGGYGYADRHWYGGYRPYYGPRYYGYDHPRSYAGYFAPGQLGPGWGPGYYEVTVFPTTYYDLPPYEEPGSYRSYVSYCFSYAC
jgi:hypothetical protein